MPDTCVKSVLLLTPAGKAGMAVDRVLSGDDLKGSVVQTLGSELGGGRVYPLKLCSIIIQNRLDSIFGCTSN